MDQTCTNNALRSGGVGEHVLTRWVGGWVTLHLFKTEDFGGVRGGDGVTIVVSEI